jgi:hypothetical protein
LPSNIFTLIRITGDALPGIAKADGSGRALSKDADYSMFDARACHRSFFIKVDWDT